MPHVSLASGHLCLARVLSLLSWVMTCMTWSLFEEIEDFLILSEQRLLAGTCYVLWLSFIMREDFLHDPNDRYGEMVEEGWFIDQCTW